MTELKQLWKRVFKPLLGLMAEQYADEMEDENALLNDCPLSVAPEDSIWA